MMQNILKKSLSCCLLFCSILLGCSACGMEAESPDTLEDILNPNRKEQETETETSFDWFKTETEETTEYHSTFFPETDVPVQSAEIPETTAVTEIYTQPVSVEIPSETTETTEPATAPVQEFPSETLTETVQETRFVPMTTESSDFSLSWEEAYYEFLLNKEYLRQISADVQEADTKFLLLYLNDDNIPELFIQTTMEVYIYSYHQNRVGFINSFYPSHYTYDFYYRPYHNTLGTLQGSVMSDGTYLEVYQFEDNDMTDSGLALKETYCYPTRDYSYEIYTERGMNIDLNKAPELDIHPDREKNVGSSWIVIPDVLQNSESVQRYEITEKELNALFGVKLPDSTEETARKDNPYAIGQIS